MGTLKPMRIGNRTIRVAGVKQKYIGNIIHAAEQCRYIERIVLFGSSVQDTCTVDSDIDLAVFGNVSKSKCLTSKQYREFTQKIYSFDNHEQAYDILYFKSSDQNNRFIMNEIDKGETIYVREKTTA
ncbi:MAG: nucleotidyltransferase domain-containing protein [Lachnospiraceae bacterium]|nr:nucleotidyltransferase domain-containing protein [Lachnospiraceae bacterium]